MFPVADALIRLGIPLIFTTGYDAAALPQQYSHVPRCEKAGEHPPHHRRPWPAGARLMAQEGTADDLALLREENARLRDALAAGKARERARHYELQHRIRNMLSVIRTVYRRTRESGASQEMFAEHFEGRLGALARNQAHLDELGPGVDLEDLIRDELLASGCLTGSNCSIEGPAVQLRSKVAELIGLAIHELTTNSIKFGAFGQGGHVDIVWTVVREGPAWQLEFHWNERDVAILGFAPRPSGFGRQLIEEALPYQLAAITTFNLRPGGVECTILQPLADFSGEKPKSSDVANLLPSEAE